MVDQRDCMKSPSPSITTTYIKCAKFVRITLCVCISIYLLYLQDRAAINLAPGILIYIWFILELYIEAPNNSAFQNIDQGTRQLIVATRDLTLILSVAFGKLSGEGGDIVSLFFGTIVFVSGLYIRLRAMKELGTQFSMILIQNNPGNLKTDGIYKIVRHPGYLGLLFIFVSFPILTQAWGVLTVSATVTLLVLFKRIELEEDNLQKIYKPDFTSYRKEVDCLIPIKFLSHLAYRLTQ